MVSGPFSTHFLLNLDQVVTVSWALESIPFFEYWNGMVSSSRVRELLEVRGKCNEQPESAWKGDFKLPEPLLHFYSQVGPSDIVIESYGNPFFLPSLARLWQHQVGYRFDASGERVEEWSSNWIVVADEGADPFIYDASTSEILFANHGAGTWKPVEAYPDLNTMAACMAILGIVRIRAGENFTDEQSYVRPEHRAEAVSRLLEVLADKEAAEAIIVNAGWG
jgi:hypothetical protein